MEHEIEEYLSFFMLHYPQMSERQILNKDWDWVDQHSLLIQKRNMEKRRWGLMASLASVAAGTHGGETMEFFNSLMDATQNEMDKESAAKLEEERIQAELESQRRERQIAIEFQKEQEEKRKAIASRLSQASKEKEVDSPDGDVTVPQRSVKLSSSV